MLEHAELPTAEPGAPGPYGLADADHVRRIFSDAGVSLKEITRALARKSPAAIRVSRRALSP